jgi:drug/metabolite transporter (DMT)-like permease
MKNYKGEFALLTATLIWGATFTIIKNALHDVSPLMFISLRFTFAAFILLPFLYKVLKQITRPVLFGGILLGIFYFLGFSTQTIGLNYTSATKSGFITGTFVIFTPILQIILERKPPSTGSIVGIILAVTGLMFLSSTGTSILSVFEEIGEGFNVGDFFTLLCALFFSFYVVYLDIISKKFDYKQLVFLQIAVTGVCGIIFTVILSFFGLETPHIQFTSNLIFAVAYTSILATIVTTILMTKYQKLILPARAGIIYALEPIFAAIVAFFVLREKISNFGFIGGALIFCGLLAAELIDKKTNTKNE